MTVRRGSIVWVELGAGEGSEQTHRRPAVIVSNDAANHSATDLGRGVVTVVPLTTSAKKPYPFQVSIRAVVSGLPHESIAQAEQVRSVDIRRIHQTQAVLPPQLMAEINQALVLHLALW